MNGLALNRMNDVVSITCYNETEKMTRREAMEFYYEGMRNSEGSEHERYETIFFQLLEGYTECSDQISFDEIPLYGI